MIEWTVLHDADDDNGKPTMWAAGIFHPEYGNWCWISDMGDHFAVEVEDTGDFVELAKCKSLTSAKRWVTMNLMKRR